MIIDSTVVRPTPARAATVMIPGPAGRATAGTPGPAPILQVGTVNTGAPGSSASVVITEIADDTYRLDFSIPAGATGGGGGSMTLADLGALLATAPTTAPAGAGVWVNGGLVEYKAS